MSWLPTLKTNTPEEGYELAIMLARMAVKRAQPDDEARARMRPDYTNSAAGLTQASQVVATNFQTVAQANDFWK